MSARLPLFADPFRLATNRFRGSGTLALADMARLSPSLHGKNDSVEVVLEGRMEGSMAVLSGRVSGRLGLQCQRCMGTLNLEVDHRFELGVITSEAEMERLPPGCEPLLYQGEPIALADVFEDELLLLLPIIPMHDPRECRAAEPGVDEPSERPGAARKRPFADLKKLIDETKH